MPPDSEPDIPPTPSLNSYASAMLKQRLARMLSHSEGVREGAATEPIHQMRVWSRRTRAALELFRTCYEGSAVNEMEREIKRVADALGEARDPDVMIQKMGKMGESLPESQRAGVSSFVETLVGDRNLCQAAVDRAVARLQKFDLEAMLETIVAVPDLPDSVEAALAGSIA
jgi:CHAD domain-containing protein